jgi:hypothetical protein
MGTYDFTAQPILNTCPPMPEIVDGGFGFQATFSRTADGGQAWFTLSTVSVNATFDGQFVSTNAATNKEPRRFASCQCTESEVGEAIRVALLSRSQYEAVSDRQSDGCPPDIFDGGLPMPTGDGGIVRPATTPNGFDAVWACGTLTDYLYGRTEHPDHCQCDDCSFTYRLSGIRR